MLRPPEPAQPEAAEPQRAGDLRVPTAGTALEFLPLGTKVSPPPAYWQDLTGQATPL